MRRFVLQDPVRTTEDEQNTLRSTKQTHSIAFPALSRALDFVLTGTNKLLRLVYEQ